MREIFTRYAAGEAQRAIARDLNQRGIPSPGASWRRESRTASGLWHVAALHAILHNEKYTGRMVWGQSRWVRGVRDSKERRRIEVPESEWVRFERPELRLIDDATWERVRMRDAPTGNTNARPKYALTGLLVCGECGGPLTISGGRNSRGHGLQRYVCDAYRQHGVDTCTNNVTVARTVAEDLLIAPLRDRLLSDENFIKSVAAKNPNFEEIPRG